MLIYGEQLIINRNKYEWETLNTPKIKIVFGPGQSEYETRIRLKCHQPIQRETITLEGELCTNWNLIDSFGVRLDFDDSIFHADGYKNFYDGSWPGSKKENHRSHYGENGFILKNGAFERFEPIGISWNDSYCRSITDTGPPGCFVQRDLAMIPDFNYQENNCTGKYSILFKVIWSL